MSLRPARWLLFFALVAAGFGCARPVATTTPPAPPPAAKPSVDLAGTEWILVTLDGKPVLPGEQVTLAFEADRLGGYGGCNWYGAPWRIDDGVLAIGVAEQTMRACVDAARMTQESDFLRTLGEVRKVEVVAQRLRLLDARGGERAVLASRPSAAMDPAALRDTRWRLREPALPAGGRPIRIAIGDGRITGHAGCRDFAAEFVARGDHLSVTATRMATMECAGAALLEREQAFTSRLSETAHYAIAGDVLTLTAAGGGTLVFDRER